MKTLNYLYVIIVLCLTFTVFTYAPILNKYWYFYLLSFFLAIKNKAIDTKMFAPLIIFSIIVLANTIMGDPIYQDVVNSIIELAALFIPVSILVYILKSRDIKTASLIIYSFLALTIYTTLISYSVNSIDPGIIRRAIMYHIDENAGYVRELYAKGLSNYLLPHGLCILIPPMVLLIKGSNRKWKKYFYASSLFAVCTLVYISGSTTSLLLSLLGLILSATLSSNNDAQKNYRVMIWTILLASPILFSSELQLYIIKVFSNIVGESSLYQEKLAEFEMAASSGQAGEDMSIRSDLLIQSLKEFFLSPLWGTSAPVGGHNAIVDRLAALGIIGIVPLYLYFKNIYQWTICFIDNRVMPFCVLSIFNGLVMLFSKNMMVWEVLVILCLIMPTMFFLYSEQIKNNRV